MTTTTEEPIDFANIRPGDSVKRLFRGVASTGLVAQVRPANSLAPAVVVADGGRIAHYDDALWFLLNRPDVDLPSQPTFGILEWNSGPSTDAGQVKSFAATWYVAPCLSGFGSGNPPSNQVHAELAGLQIPIRNVISFTPAAVVTAEDLNTLREARNGQFADCNASRAIGTFLEKTSKANKGAGPKPTGPLSSNFQPTVTASLASLMRNHVEVDRLETEMRALGTPQADLDWLADLCGGFVWTYRDALNEMKRHVIEGKDPIAKLRAVADKAGLG